MSGVVELCNLVKSKDATVAQLMAFLNSASVDINQPDPADKYPIEYIVELGNADVLQYFLEVLNANVNVTHKIESPDLLELCRDNPSTKAYLLNPKNRIWERFTSGIAEIHIATATGNFERIRELRTQNFENLFKRSGFSSYLLDWAYKFSQQKLLVGLINYFNQLIEFHKKRKNYEYVAKFHEIFAHYLYFSKSDIKAGLKHFQYAHENYKLALVAHPKNDKLKSLLSISHLNVAAALVSFFDATKIYLLDKIIFNMNKAKELFKQTSGDDIREFNRKLVSIFDHFRAFMIEAFETGKQVIDLQKQFDAEIEILLSDIPESQRTKSDNYNLLIARERLGATTSPLAQLKTPEAKANSREEKRIAEFNEIYAADQVSLSSAFNHYRTAMNELNYSSALRSLNEYKYFLDKLHQHYLDSPDLQCEKITKDFESKFKLYHEYEENMYDVIADAPPEEVHSPDDEKTDFTRSDAINIKQPAATANSQSHSHPVATEFLAIRYEPKFYKSFTGAVEELDDKIQRLKLSNNE